MVKKTKNEQLLDRLFKDLRSPSAFTSVVPLLHQARLVNPKITRRQVQKYLAGQKVYTLHRRVVRKYQHMPTLAPGLHTEWQCDLADFRQISRLNRGFNYLLVCIDTLGRQLFVEPVKSKHSGDMIDAFKRIFAQARVIPWKLLSDSGKEFTAKPVQKLFNKNSIEHFTMQTSPRFHAGMAERANRSIKERLYRYFAEQKTQKWVDVIEKIVSAINRSRNSQIDMRPVDVTYKNAEELRKKLKEKAINRFQKKWNKAKFRVNDYVRMEKHKHVFQKGYVPNFTPEIYVVYKLRMQPAQPPMYRLRNMDGEQINAWFYANDLCRVREKKDNELYDIERVIRTRRQDDMEYAFVKWKGYGREYNSWVPADSIILR